MLWAEYLAGRFIQKVGRACFSLLDLIEASRSPLPFHLACWLWHFEHILSMKMPPAECNLSTYIEELQEELQTLRRDESDAPCLLDNIELQVQAKIECTKEGLNDLESISSSESAYIELVGKIQYLEMLQYLENAKVEGFMGSKLLDDEKGDALGHLHIEICGIEDAKVETRKASEASIKMIEKDAEGMEAFRKSALVWLDACDKVKEALTSSQRHDDCHDNASKEELDDILVLKRNIEENMWEEKRTSKEIKLKTKKSEELQRLTKTINKYLQEELTLEYLKRISVLSIDKGNIVLQLHMDFTGTNDLLFNKKMSHMNHELHVQFNPSTSLLENAQLDLGDLHIQDIVSAIKSSHSASGLSFRKEHKLFEQLNFLVREVYHRISPTWSTLTDCRYNLQDL